MDNFNMKQWLQENKVGPYTKTLLNEMNPAALGMGQEEADDEMLAKDSEEGGDWVDNASMDVVAEDDMEETVGWATIEKPATESADDERDVSDLEREPSDAFKRFVSQKRGEEAEAARIKQATNADGQTFVIGDVAKTPDGKTIKITGFRLGARDKKMKAIYNAGMYADVYDLDNLDKLEVGSLKKSS